LTTITSIKIRSDETWVEYSAKEIGRAPGEIDIAVLQIDKRFGVDDLPAPADMGGLVLGQDVFFVGFPYKLEGPVGFVRDHRPLGYVKKGTVSVLDSQDHPVLVIDAINNEGFSGGPVVFTQIGRAANELKIAAIVSKYRTEQEYVIGLDGKKTGETIQYNTGFLYAYSIRYAIDLIRAYRA
jgi:hypothetical protein